MFTLSPFKAQQSQRSVPTLSIILLSLVLVSLSGCSSIPVSQDYQATSALKNYATYQWLPIEKQTVPTTASLKKSHPFITLRIEKAIQENLHNRRAIFVRQAPEAYVNYHYSVTKTQTVAPSSTIGFGLGSRNIGFGTRFPMDYSTEIHEEAKWGIDIHNAAGELIWRGESVGAVEEFASPQAAEKNTQAIVDAILSQYPPK
ncbi:MAG: DUF4136 domain-containing protein [Thiomicrorhabdus sp.]|jgi:uncharacterized protein YceK|nr:DUF4136 domain-containing protein [Thiomicrorhabdus sp.]